MTTNYTTEDSEIEVRADWAKSEAYIYYRRKTDVEDGLEEWHHADLTVAQARHQEVTAIRMVGEWLEQQ